MITKEATEAAKKAAPPFWRDTANFEKHVSKILTAALAAMPAEREIDEGRFEQWTLADFAGQCRMQARDNLDPEYSQFMAALSARLSALAAMPAQGEHSVVAAFEKAYPELYYHIAKGKICAGEPLYGAIITTAGATDLGHGESNVSADDAFQIAMENAALHVPPTPSLAAENERLREAHDDGVKFGIALSIAFLLRDRDEPVIAEEWWDATGMTIDACERIGLDEYDLAPIRAALEDRT